MSTKDNNNKLYVRVGIVHFFEKNKKKNRYCKLVYLHLFCI